MSALPSVAGTPLPDFVIECREALRSSYEELRSHTQMYAGETRSGSLAREEQEKIAGMGQCAVPRRQLWVRGFGTIQITTASAEDHIFSTIARLAGPDIPLFAHATLARAACEATARVAYLLDPEISVERRLVRFGASIRHAMEDQLKGAKQLPEDSYAVRMGVVGAGEQRLKEMDTHLDACGMEVRKERGRARLVVRPDGPDALLAPQISALAQEAFAHRPTWYKALSGTAHSLEWALAASAPEIGPDGDMQIPANLLELGTSVLLELDAIALLDRRFAQFFGHDSDPALQVYRERMDAVDKGMLRMGVN